MKRTEHERDFAASDLLAAVAGGVFGLGLGYILGSSVGRVNSRRISRAVRRWQDRRGANVVWTEDEAERLEARVLDALSNDVVLARRPIRVAVLGMGLVELTGTVHRSTEAGLAGDVTQHVAGVETVLNHLLVDGVDQAAVPVGGPDAPRAARV
ncbi:MAG: BON domain-containing protein [Gemmatimonadales bacterium]